MRIGFVEAKHMVLGPPACPILHRWRIKVAGRFSLGVHHFVGGKVPQLQHDHPWWFITFVLRGSYLDVGPQGTELMRAGRIAFRPAHHRHATVETEGCWTLVLNGPVRRDVRAWLGDRPIPPGEMERIEALFCNS